MKSAKPSTVTSKRSQGEACTIAPTSGATPTAEDTFVGPTAVVNPSGGVADVDPTVAHPLSLRAMMESFMTT